jgi:hypothetical protein
MPFVTTPARDSTQDDKCAFWQYAALKIQIRTVSFPRREGGNQLPWRRGAQIEWINGLDTPPIIKNGTCHSERNAMRIRQLAESNGMESRKLPVHSYIYYIYTIGSMEGLCLSPD